MGQRRANAQWLTVHTVIAENPNLLPSIQIRDLQPSVTLTPGTDTPSAYTGNRIPCTNMQTPNTYNRRRKTMGSTYEMALWVKVSATKFDLQKLPGGKEN